MFTSNTWFGLVLDLLIYLSISLAVHLLQRQLRLALTPSDEKAIDSSEDIED
ncbi:hypothetical protein ACEQ8H_005473 [Pleosporales sp. CAS-2024a]